MVTCNYFQRISGIYQHSKNENISPKLFLSLVFPLCFSHHFRFSYLTGKVSYITSIFQMVLSAEHLGAWLVKLGFPKVHLFTNYPKDAQENFSTLFSEMCTNFLIKFYNLWAILQSPMLKLRFKSIQKKLNHDKLTRLLASCRST